MGWAHVIKHVLRTFSAVAVGACARQVAPGAVPTFMLRNNVINCGVAIT